MLQRDLEFLFEMGCMKNVDRTRKQFHRNNAANLAEHTFRVMWIVLIIAKHEGLENTGKLVQMALVHDVSESRSVDTHYLSKSYVQRDETNAINDTFDSVSIQKEFVALWEEENAKESLEAQIIKDADMLDVDFEIREEMWNGNKLAQDWYNQRKERILPKFHTNTAKKMFEEIYEINPHSWHLDGKIKYYKE